MQSLPPNQSKGRRKREGRKNLTYVFVSLSYRISSTVAPSSYSKNTTSLPDLLTKEAQRSRTWPRNEENPVQMTAKAIYAPHRRSAENHTLFTWQLVIDAEREIRRHDSAPASCSSPWTSTSGKSTSRTHGFWWPLQDRTQGKGQTVAKLSFKIISQNHEDLLLQIEEALAIKTLKPKLNKRQEEIGTGFLPWTLSQLLLPFPNASFTPLTVHSLLLSHLLTPILLTPLRNIHTTSIPQHFYPTHSHSSLTLKFHTSLTYLKRAKHHSFPNVSYGSFHYFSLKKVQHTETLETIIVIFFVTRSCLK